LSNKRYKNIFQITLQSREDIFSIFEKYGMQVQEERIFLRHFLFQLHILFILNIKNFTLFL